MKAREELHVLQFYMSIRIVMSLSAGNARLAAPEYL